MDFFEIRTYADVSEVYERLLKPSFPRDELVDLDHLTRGWREGRMDLVVAATPEGLPAAVAVSEFDVDSGIVLLAYLAVAPQMRGTGVGQELLAAALERWKKLYDPRMIVGEVEHPSSTPKDPNHGDPRRRVAFYQRFAPRVMQVPYYQPRVRLLGRRVPSMMLVVFDDMAPGPDHRVASAPVRLWLGRMMSLEPRDDARRRLFAAVADEWIETMPMDAPDEELPADGGINLTPRVSERVKSALPPMEKVTTTAVGVGKTAVSTATKAAGWVGRRGRAILPGRSKRRED